MILLDLCYENQPIHWWNLVFYWQEKMLLLVATIGSTFAIDSAIQRKMRGKTFSRVGKGVILATLNVGMDHIIVILTLQENVGKLIDGITETVKHEMKNPEIEFLVALVPPLAA